MQRVAANPGNEAGLPVAPAFACGLCAGHAKVVKISEKLSAPILVVFLKKGCS